MQLSLVIPSRNNQKYFEWAYNSIRQNQGNHEVYICAANDASTDSTLEYFQQLQKQDPLFSFIDNPGPERIGHTILYDEIVDRLVKTDIMGIYHADMYLCPGSLDVVETLIKPQTVVSLTRIEPPLWPPGPEKVIQNFGFEPEEFDEKRFLEWYKEYRDGCLYQVTDGVFAPWFIYTGDYRQHGHDKLFSPQSREDSDIFNRFKMSSYTFLQPRDANVYHLTCRGSRRNPTLTNVKEQDSNEWTRQNRRSHRNFFRKWGSDVLVTPTLSPKISPKHRVYGKIIGCTAELLELLEPHFTKTFVDIDASNYIESEQKETLYDMNKRVFNVDELSDDYGVLVEVNGQLNQSEYEFIKNIGTHDLKIEDGHLKGQNIEIYIKDLTRYEQENNKCLF